MPRPGRSNRLQAAGAREYLTKPLDVRQMIALLESTLQCEPAEQDASESVKQPQPPPSRPR